MQVNLKALSFKTDNFIIYFEGLFLQDDANAYTTLEQQHMSSNPNVYFQRSPVNPNMIY